MPPPTFPPTPGPSGHIKGQESATPKHTDPAFILPPSAVNSGPSADYIGGQSPPTSPRTAPENRKSGQIDVSLPPPPTRSRKIIQMKPKAQASEQPKRAASRRQSETEAATSSRPGTADSQANNGEGKKKGNSGNTAAGKKVARKTAHSIIERRRRSKMNEEFATLKDLIPACSGQEMHKLAILQASIDYLRYLEQCVADLKANRGQDLLEQESTTPNSRSQDFSGDAEVSDAGSDDDDMEVDERTSEEAELTRVETAVSSIAGSTAVTSPAFSAQSNFAFSRTSSLGQPSPSPVIRPSHSYEHHGAAANALPSIRSPPRPSLSNQTSPDLSGQRPRFEDNNDLTEASAALLMLNATDRRSMESRPLSKPGQRGMSVKELLRG